MNDKKKKETIRGAGMEILNSGSRMIRYTKRDKKMLEVVVSVYNQLEYTLAKKEVPNAVELKTRFRI